MPGDAFIYEALILTMATSVRWRGIPAKSPEPLSLPVGTRGTKKAQRLQHSTRERWKVKAHASVPKKTVNSSTSPPISEGGEASSRREGKPVGRITSNEV